MSSMSEDIQYVIARGTEGAVHQVQYLLESLTTFQLKKGQDIWENVKMILEGSELTKDDRESQLYDEFEHFRQNKGETIQGYYVRFTKLINDMRNIKMTMPRMQLNSKFLYAYLKQHESLQSSNEPSLADNFQLDSGSSSTENLIESLSNSLALLTQLYKSHLPQTNNQLRTSSNARNKATVQDTELWFKMSVEDTMRTIKENHFRETMLEEMLPKQLQDSDYFKDKMLLMQAQENGAVLDEEQSLFLTGEQIINFE
ncbi:hypothetical protein Tco_0609433 [Tanacetum coccineum]